MSASYEVLVDKGETPNKCTILPLAYRRDLSIVRFERGVPIPPLAGRIFLHPDGESLETIPREAGAGDGILLSLVDSLWRRLDQIVALIERPLPRLAKIPPGFRTSYPRRNKKNMDPEDGLATIEALFLGAAFLGRWDETLLEQYHFAQEFLDINREAFMRYQLGPKPCS